MTDWPEALDPNLKEVLLDVTRDERSTLFRVTPRDVGVRALDDAPSASARTAGWTPAERHLLEAHREDAARVLRNAFRVEVARDEQCRILFLDARTTTRRRGASTEEVREDARLLSRASSLAPLDDEVRSTLKGLATGREDPRASLAQLAAAALRLEDNDVTRILQSVDLLARGDRIGVRTLLHGVLDRVTRRDLRACAWANLALADSLEENMSGAVKAFSKASQLDPEDLSLSVSTMLCALYAGDEARTRQTSELVDKNAHDAEAEVEEIIAIHRERSRQKMLCFPDHAHRLMSRIDDTLGPVSGHIAHAVLKQK